MIKVNASSLEIETEDSITDVTSAGDDRKFNFKLTDKKAKSNLIKSANRSQFEIEIKQQSLNLRFSAQLLPAWLAVRFSSRGARRGPLNTGIYS